jgi:hypothetical protein
MFNVICETKGTRVNIIFQPFEYIAGLPEWTKGIGSGLVGVGLQGFESPPLHSV